MAVFGSRAVGGGGGRRSNVVQEIGRDDRVAFYTAMVWFDQSVHDGPPDYDSVFSPYTDPHVGGGYQEAVNWMTGAANSHISGQTWAADRCLTFGNFRRHIFWNMMGFPVVPPPNFPITPFGITNGNPWMTDAYRDSIALVKAMGRHVTVEMYTGPFMKSPHELPGGEDPDLKMYDPDVHTWFFEDCLNRWIQEVGIRGVIWMDATSVPGTLELAMAMRDRVRGIRIGAEAIPTEPSSSAPNWLWHREWHRKSPSFIGWQHFKDNVFPNMGEDAPRFPFHEIVVNMAPGSDLVVPTQQANQDVANEAVARGYVLATGLSNEGYDALGRDMLEAAYAANGLTVPY